MTLAVQCLWCERKATRWCDEVIGCPGEMHQPPKEPGHKLRAPYMAHVPMEKHPGMHTCDAPMCARHAHQVGHVCFRGGKHRGCESIDHCPLHITSTGIPPFLTVEQAAELRRELHAGVRRERMRATPSA